MTEKYPDLPDAETSKDTVTGPMFLYDTLYGELLVGKEAEAFHYEAGGHPADVRDLGDLLVDIVRARRTGVNGLGRDGRPVLAKADDYPRGAMESLDRDSMVANGAFLSGLIDKASGGTETVIQDVFVQASYRDISPTISTIYAEFGRNNLSVYYDEIGASGARHVYAWEHWSAERFLQYVDDIARQTKQVDNLMAERARNNEGPHPDVMLEKTGMTVSDALKRNGYFVQGMYDEEEMLDIGVNVKEANDGRKIDDPVLNYLSKARRTPSDATVRRYFGSVPAFDEVAQEKYESTVLPAVYARDDRAWDIREAVKDGTLPRYVAQNIKDDFTVRERAAKYELAQAILPGISSTQLHDLAVAKGDSFFRKAIEINVNLTQAEIEHVAIEMGVYEDAWPAPHDHLAYLKLPDELPKKPRPYRQRKSEEK